MKVPPILAIIVALIFLSLSACNMDKDEYQTKARKITAISPHAKAVTLTHQYVCQIQSQRQIKVRALEKGYLDEIPVREGQMVKQGDLMFKVRPILRQTKPDAEMAEAKLSEQELNKKLYGKVAPQNGLVQNEVAVLKARVATARAELAAAELDSANVKAPFEGIVGRLQNQQGSLIEKGEVLTTLSDNSLMSVYFNVPEARYLEYMTELNQKMENLQIELVLANGAKFQQAGKIGAIEADFNKQTGTVSFRADFPNPERRLRHGQRATVLISRVQNDAIVIPQRATFEILEKRYVYIIDKDDVAHQREIIVQNELEDIFVIKTGVGVKDKIVLEGIRQVHDGDKVDSSEDGQ